LSAHVSALRLCTCGRQVRVHCGQNTSYRS
jgi:hypothetical protein